MLKVGGSEEHASNFLLDSGAHAGSNHWHAIPEGASPSNLFGFFALDACLEIGCSLRSSVSPPTEFVTPDTTSCTKPISSYSNNASASDSDSATPAPSLNLQSLSKPPPTLTSSINAPSLALRGGAGGGSSTINLQSFNAVPSLSSLSKGTGLPSLQQSNPPHSLASLSGSVSLKKVEPPTLSSLSGPLSTLQNGGGLARLGSAGLKSGATSSSGGGVISDALSAMSLGASTLKPALIVPKVPTSGSVTLASLGGSSRLSIGDDHPAIQNNQTPLTARSLRSTDTPTQPFSTKPQTMSNLQLNDLPSPQSSIWSPPSGLAQFWESSNALPASSLTVLQKMLSSNAHFLVLDAVAVAGGGQARFDFKTPSPDDVVLAAREKEATCAPSAQVGVSGSSN
ncbi:hypothetical protein BC830DRAFT_299877 [Chytriomyces sp. MP71]|nr:hypothetical protein BC830DRAFT_299877 [Chytriomyces sp. MP71]